ncbi:MAG: hypothetical protein H6994_12155 [Pseudomonadales bacterium]|nr:hypothetical protein [Pseudomonadales bacterium]
MIAVVRGSGKACFIRKLVDDGVEIGIDASQPRECGINGFCWEISRAAISCAVSVASIQVKSFMMFF